MWVMYEDANCVSANFWVLRPHSRPEIFATPKIYLILSFYKNMVILENTEIFGKKMKFKTRLVAGNSIWPAKIRPEGPLSLLKLWCKII